MDGERIVEVWQCHMVALETYQRCQPSVLSGMGLVYLGVSAQEVRAALAIGRVCRDQWPEVADDVMAMGRAAAEYRNRETQRQAARR